MRQFEPAEISISVEGQVDPGDKPETVATNVRKFAREQVEQEYTRLKQFRKESYDDEMEKSA